MRFEMTAAETKKYAQQIRAFFPEITQAVVSRGGYGLRCVEITSPAGYSMMLFGDDRPDDIRALLAEEKQPSGATQWSNLC